MATVYEQHDKAFSNVSSYIVVKGGERFATINFKHPADGAGRLWVYVQVHGADMVRGFASGFGYDKHTAAITKAYDAAYKIGQCHRPYEDECYRLWSTLHLNGHKYWYSALRDAGFDVWQTV